MKKPASAPRPDPAAFQNALRQAMGVHQGGKLADAERAYRALLAVAPKHPDVLHYLGVALHQQGQHEEAMRLIKRALAIAPAYVDARNNLGNIQKECGLPAEAEQSYRAVIKARPEHALAHNNLGVVLKEQERHADAVLAYRACLALKPDYAEGWINLGNACKATGEVQEAMTAYREAILLAPQSPEAYRNLGQALVTSQRFAEALDVYRCWQEQEPDNAAIAHMIAACAGDAPERASDGYVQNTFDRFADSFDDVLKRLDYRAPALCGAMITELFGEPDKSRAILDAGCGTGLCAPFLLPYAKRLDGVDLSSNMLAKAAERGGYDKLEEAELTAWLGQQSAAYDLIVSADTLCYFGALDDVLAACAKALRPNGTLIFTVEETADAVAAPQFMLHPHGRYSHTDAYVRAALQSASLTVAHIERAVLRTELDLPVAGLVVAATASET